MNPGEIKKIIIFHGKGHGVGMFLMAKQSIAITLTTNKLNYISPITWHISDSFNEEQFSSIWYNSFLHIIPTISSLFTGVGNTSRNWQSVIGRDRLKNTKFKSGTLYLLKIEYSHWTVILTNKQKHNYSW